MTPASTSSRPLRGVLAAPFERDTVHVVELPLPDAFDELPRAAALLAPEERDRARRIVAPLARRRFVAGRVALRSVLSRRARTRPSRIVLTYGPNGKPCAPGSGLTFNVAHSDTWILIAVAETHEIGVDVEEAFTLAEAAALTRKVLDVREAARVAASSFNVRPSIFQRYWVAKEALLKAAGDGFGRSPIDVHVRLNSGFARIGQRPYALLEWSVDHATRAAVALAGVERARLVRHPCSLDTLLSDMDDNGRHERCG